MEPKFEIVKWPSVKRSPFLVRKIPQSSVEFVVTFREVTCESCPFGPCPVILPGPIKGPLFFFLPQAYDVINRIPTKRVKPVSFCLAYEDQCYCVQSFGTKVIEPNGGYTN